MERTKGNIFSRIDWPLVALFAILATMGWLSICGASYSYIESDFLDFFSISERTGKQAMWMGVSLLVGTVLLCIDKNSYKDFAPIIYAATMLLGIITIFVGNRQQIIPPMAYRTKPTAVTFRLPNFLARGHTAKIPIPMGIPPMTESRVWVMPSL